MKKNYRNLGQFITALDAAGELLRITEPVSPILEITEIANRAAKHPGGGKALLFEQVENSSMPVLINAFGSPERICIALGVENLDELAARIRAILNMRPPLTWGDRAHLVKEALSWSRFLPKTVKRGAAPCQEVVLQGSDVDLTRLPVLRCWPEDGGPFVTLPLVFTEDLDGRRNVGMYRLQVFDRATMGMHWQIHKDGAYHFHEYGNAKKRMEVAVAIGTDPATTYAATAPLPPGIDEMLLAGFIRQSPVEMVKGITVNIHVPAEAEIVLEGYVDYEERRIEGPFGDHTGFYSLADHYPVFHVTAITHRKNAVYSTTIVGRPPMEDCYLGLATERIFLPLLQMLSPEIVDFRLPWDGVFHNLVLVSINKRFPGHAQKIMHSLWGSGQMSFSKAVIVCDAPIDLSKDNDIIQAILNTVDLDQDLLITRGILDALDHSAPEALLGGKAGIDITARVAGERSRVHPKATGEPRWAEETLRKNLKQIDTALLDIRLLFAGTIHPLICATVEAANGRKQLVQSLLSSTLLPASAIIVLFDSYAQLSDQCELLWRACSNADPERDFFAGNGRFVIDATARKTLNDSRQWPDEIRMTKAIKDRITAKAEKLGIAHLKELDSSHYV